MEAKLFLIFQRDHSLVVHMGGYFNNLEMQECAMEALEIVHAKKLKKMLLDITKLEVLLNVSQVWTKDVWHPTAENYGLQFLAMIVPIGFLTKQDLAIFNSGDRKKVLIKFFETEKPAIDWLDAMN